MVSVWNACLFTINGAFGILLNVFAIVIIVRSRELMVHRSSKFIINQSVIDAITSVALILGDDNLIHGFGLVVTYQDGNPGSELLCRTWDAKYFMWGLIKSSTANLVITTLERYVKFVHKKWYKRHIGRKSIITLLVLPWLFGLVYQAAFFMYSNDVRGNKCMNQLWPSKSVPIGIGAFSFVYQFVTPICIFVFSYGSIYYHLRKRQNNAQNPAEDDMEDTDTSDTEDINGHVKNGDVKPLELNNLSSTVENEKDTIETARKKQNKKARRVILRMLLIVSIAFFLCWVCNQVFFFLVNIQKIKFMDYNRTPFYYIVVWLAFCNCWVNPIIYMTQFSAFRPCCKG